MALIDYNADIEPQLRGMWPEIFASIGVEIPRLKNRNGPNMPCPLCGGDDRAHWREEGGRITLYCRHCSGDKAHSPEYVFGQLTGMAFPDVAKEMAKFANHMPIEVKAQVRERVAKSQEPEYSAVMPSHECDLFISEQPVAPLTPLTLVHGLGLNDVRMTKKNQTVVPVYKMYDNGKTKEKRLVNVALLDVEGNIEWLAGKPTQFGYVTIGQRRPGKPIYICADWVDAQIAHIATGGAEIVCAFMPWNMRDMLWQWSGLVAEDRIRAVCNRDYDELAEVEKAAGCKAILPVGERIKECNFKFERAVYSVSELLDVMERK